MPRLVRVVAWVLVFAGAAGVGAYVAAHSDPFPPSVEGSSSTPTISLTPTSPGPAPTVWKGSIKSATSHDLHVGGRCTTNWRGSLTLGVDASGAVLGRAVVRRVGALRCDFATAQSQVERYEVEVSGQLAANGFALRFVATSSVPATGADDYGGFLHTLLQPDARPFIVIQTDPGASAGVLVIHRPDQEDLGTYESRTRIRLGCVRRCTA